MKTVARQVSLIRRVWQQVPHLHCLMEEIE
jgi:hypothetical protein